MDRAQRGAKLQRLRLAKAVDFTAFLLILQIYVHDLFFALFLPTVFVHQCLTPLIPGWQLAIPRRSQRAVFVAIVVLRIASMAAHVFRPLPGTSFDGRNHGWLFVEFIGETAVSRGWLLTWDVMLLGLQIAGFLITFPVPRDPSAEPGARSLETETPAETPGSLTPGSLAPGSLTPGAETAISGTEPRAEPAETAEPTETQPELDAEPAEDETGEDADTLIGPMKVTMKELQSGHAVIYTLDLHALTILWQLQDPDTPQEVLPMSIPLASQV